MNKIFNEIENCGILPTVELNNVKDTKLFAKVLIDCGLLCAEIKLGMQATEESICIINQEYPDIIIGLGSVSNTDQVDRAINAGAKFIVSSEFNEKLLQYCITKNIPVVPEVVSENQIEKAIEYGIEVVKVSITEAIGSSDMIKNISEKYSTMKFILMGDVDKIDINTYLESKNILACACNYLVNNELSDNKNFEKITELTREIVMTMLGFEVRHVGINCDNATEAEKTADKYDKLFGFKKKIGNSSTFAGIHIEVMHKNFLGEKGHLAIATHNVQRAFRYLKSLGVEFNMETAKYNKSNRLIVIYLRDEIAGFAVHLMQK